jgi:hypothetical protein
VGLTCVETREAAAEFALGILDPAHRDEVARHLCRCHDCRVEVAGLTEVALRLLDVLPGTEPPLGFDRAVLFRVRPGRMGGAR